MAGCVDDETPIQPDYPDPLEVVISDVLGIPPGVVFDRVSVEVSGYDWQTIRVVEAPYASGRAVLTLPSDFGPEDLQQVDRGPGAREMWGYWPSTSSDPDALVASLRTDIFAWNGDQKVGLLSFTDWTGEGSTIGKSFINFQLADRPFTLDGFTGGAGSFIFNNCAFQRGWNAFAKENASASSIRIRTGIPSDPPGFDWYFRSL